MGRKSVFQTPMTPAERQRRRRDRIKNGGAAALPASIGEAIIERWFIEAGRNSSFKTPPVEVIKGVAKTINGVLPLYSSPVDIVDNNIANKNIELACKHGSQFIYQANKVREQLEERREISRAQNIRDSASRAPPDWIEQINLATGRVSLVLAWASITKSRAIHWQHMALFFAAIAAIAWAKEGGLGTSPRERDPVCTFVLRALEYMGIPISRSMVSRLLKGKRGHSRLKE